MSVSNRSHAAKQKLDNRKRQYDGDDNHHRVARRDRRFGFAIGDDEWTPVAFLCVISVQRSTHGIISSVSGSSVAIRVRGSTEVWRWNRDPKCGVGSG